MTIFSLLLLILVVAVVAWLIRLVVPDAMLQRVLIILLAVLAVFYVLANTGFGAAFNAKL